MNAELKDIFSLEIDCALAAYVPNEPTTFAVGIRMLIGLPDTDASETFDVTVCTPAWIAAELTAERLMWGANLLVVETYDYATIELAIRNRIAQATGSTWVQIAQKISRWALWEFEDYRPAPELE